VAAGLTATQVRAAIDGEPPRDRGLTGGLIALATTAVLLMVLIGEVIPPVVAFVVAFIGLAIGISRSDARWLRWAAATTALLLLVANAPFAASDLAHPESPAGFVPTLVLVLTALVTAVIAVAAALGKRVRARRAWVGAVAVVALGVLLSVISAAGVTDDVPVTGDIEVRAADVAYPARIEVPIGGAVAITNDDPIHHTFVVEQTGDGVDLPGGATRRLAVDLPAGEYGYICDVPGHESMRGTLVVG
jgi:plastocyanin